MSLAAAFTSGLPSAITRDVSDARLEPALAALLARAAAAHPGLTLEGAAFAAHLGRAAGPEWPAVSRLLAEAAVEDLYLACACALGDAAAVAHARARYRAAFHGYLARLKLTDGELDDLQQSLWERMLGTPADGGPPRIARYAGTGELGSWIGIAAQRLALTLRRQQGADERRDEALRRELTDAISGPETRFLRERYRREFELGFRAALGELSDRDRAILRLQAVGGLSLDKIAPMYGVNASTISRWAAQARASVLDSTRRYVAARVRLSADEFDSLAGALVSVLDVTLGQLMSRSE